MHAVLVPDDAATLVPAAHDFVAVLDDDAQLSGHAVAQAVAVLDRHPGVGIVFIHVSDGPGPMRRDGSVLPGHRWLGLAAEHGPDAVASRCAVLRRTTYDLCDPPLLGTRRGELSLWLRAAAVADVASVVEPLPAVRLEPIPRRLALTGDVCELHERALAFRDLFDGFDPLRGQDRPRGAAYRSIARRARGRAWVAAFEGDAVESSLCRHLAQDLRRWRRRG